MLIAILAVTVVALAILLAKYLKAIGQLKKYKPITDIEKAALELNKQMLESKKELEKTIIKNKTETQSILEEKNKLILSRDQLLGEINVLNDDHDLLSAGFYKSRYDFDNSKSYEAKLDDIRDRQKELIKNKKAIICSTEWSVGGSKAEGKKMIDRVIKLGLSAFNVQCDNEILRVKFDNIDRAEEKLNKIQDNINKLLEPNQCTITNEFFKCKLEELFLAYEYQNKLNDEKEEQRALREQMKEEERARREAEKAQGDAEREEKRYETALEKAREELGKKSDADKEAFLLKIQELESRLQEAHKNKERAKSMAEQTKRGNVYIISNIGSFGENVFKIGMTRRLDPMDRIYELGDASVPFDFDVHAIISSDDAPALEKQLHQKFSTARVNKVNERKEFFRVNIAEIEREITSANLGEIKLTLIAEAKEYRQTVALVSTNKTDSLINSKQDEGKKAA